MMEGQGNAAWGKNNANRGVAGPSPTVHFFAPSCTREKMIDFGANFGAIHG
jgi:hypothetical protein